MEDHVSARRMRTRARIAAHAIWDLMARPDARAGDVPFHAEAVTAPWITAVFEHAAPGARAEAVRIVGGDDGSSVRRGIQVDWNAAGRAGSLPTRLFAKSTPTLATRLSAGMAAPSEGRFLMDVRPSLDIEAPVCRWSGRDPDSGRSLHLFDDLTETRGASFCQVDTVIGLDQAEGMIDTLATLHGSLRDAAESLDWLNTYEGFFEAGRRSGIQDGHEQALTRAAPVIPAGLMARRDEIWPAAARAAASHAAQPRTVIHSDVHLGNWYVTGDGHMGLSDWARVCRGLWARDVAYMLTAALSIDDRRAWEMLLIDRYVRKMESFGLGIGGEEALRLYRRQMFPALLMWTPTLCPPPMLPDMQPERMSLAMIERITTAIDDHRALDSFEE